MFSAFQQVVGWVERQAKPITYGRQHGFRQAQPILGFLEGVPDDEQAKIVGLNTARVYRFDVARLAAPA